MLYKTIVLELIEEQYPTLYEQLRASRSLLQAMDDYAASLKRYHEDRMDSLAIARPEADPQQVASRALELAIEDLREDLLCGSARPEAGDQPLSLDAAMGFIRSHTPPA
jgi:hypothetical protein